MRRHLVPSWHRTLCLTLYHIICSHSNSVYIIQCALCFTFSVCCPWSHAVCCVLCVACITTHDIRQKLYKSFMLRTQYSMAMVTIYGPFLSNLHLKRSLIPVHILFDNKNKKIYQKIVSFVYCFSCKHHQPPSFVVWFMSTLSSKKQSGSELRIISHRRYDY